MIACTSLRAQPGQHGLMHANCQSKQYVACAMRFLGFIAEPTADSQLAGIVFRKNATAAPRLPDHPNAAFVHAYRAEMRQRCGFTTWGHLSGSARTIRQLTAWHASLGQPMTHRVCDGPAPEYRDWRKSVYRRARWMANATGDGVNALRQQEIALFEALAVDEVSPANQRRLQRLAQQNKSIAGRGASVLDTSFLPTLSAENATIEHWLAWLNNTVWGLCVPPWDGFCYYSRTTGRRQRECSQ